MQRVTVTVSMAYNEAWKKFPHGILLKVIYKKDAFLDKKDQYFIITAYFIKNKK